MSKDRDIMEVLKSIEVNMSSMKEDLNRSLEILREDDMRRIERKMERATYR